MACNLTGNAVRLFFVLRLTGLRPSWRRILLRPAFALLLSWQLSALAMLLVGRIPMQNLTRMGVFCTACLALYLFMLRVTDRLSAAHSVPVTAGINDPPAA